MSFILTAAVLVGKPILKSVGKELLGLWIESDWAKEAIVEGADGWAIRLYAKLSGGDRRAELERAFDAIASAQPAELDALVAEVTDEAVAETTNVTRAASPSPSDLRSCLSANLRLATERIRSAARPDVLDHAGRPTIPRSLIPRDAADLLRFLPILPPSAHQPGDTLYPQAAHLTLVRLLGVGGFGEVWETQNNNRRSEPHMAVKIFTHPDAARFIELENRNMALIARMMENDPHPGIVPILQNHLHSCPPALAYELVQGRELSWLVQAWHDGSQGRSGPQPDQAARLLLRIADIVAHFHRHGIIHRDLKPANILIDTATLSPRITDFGLSQAQAASEASPKAAQRHSLASVTALKGSGTVGYASPEQFDRNVPADVRDDVHALGVIGYELLTGQLPRGGMSRAMERKLIACGVTEGLVDILAQCLEQKREDRLGSVRMLVEGLAELCGPPKRPLSNENWEASLRNVVETPWASASQGCKPTIPIILLSFGIIYFLALFSYDPRDLPAWAPFNPTDTSNLSPANLIGTTGAIVACYSFMLMGFSSYLLPFYLIQISVSKFTAGVSITTRNLFGITLLILSASAYMHVVGIGAVRPDISPLGPGGAVGRMLGGRIAFNIFGQPVASILLGAICLFSLCLVFGVSPISAFKNLRGKLAELAGWLRQRMTDGK